MNPSSRQRPLVINCSSMNEGFFSLSAKYNFRYTPMDGISGSRTGIGTAYLADTLCAQHETRAMDLLALVSTKYVREKMTRRYSAVLLYSLQGAISCLYLCPEHSSGSVSGYGVDIR